MGFETLSNWFLKNPVLGQIVSICGVTLLAFAVFSITKKFLFHWLSRLIQKSKTEWDDLLLDKAVLRRIAYIAPILVVYNFAYIVPSIEQIVQRISIALMSLFVVMIIGTALSALNAIYDKLQYAKGKPIKGYIQIVKIIIYISGVIIIIGILTGRSPWFLISSIGALTAVILLIFRDTILSLVASMQMSSNDLVRVGDWIEVPAFGADGDVIDIALHTIKVQNWDKTITTIPTHKLIDVSFKNWRGMQLTGGRRVKRALYIDQASIKFCTDEMIQHFSKLSLISEYIKCKNEEILQYNRDRGIDNNQIFNGRRLTNIGTFRAYVEAYLRQHDKVHKGLTCMVRQLAPGPSGLPLEIYLFINDTVWTSYEGIQSDIFDHILAVVPEFELRIFQNPTGKDFQKITSYHSSFNM
ncbi:MAG: mechanosensitive ion channel family protein [Spirochaetota bacterium]|nr:mechanosensitive ion channel family protein [Spirochaetota bacterium]